MSDLLIQEWKEIQDLTRKLNIISLVSYDITSDNYYVIDVIPHPDVKLKVFHYETKNLDDMIDKLSNYYLRAKEKDEIQKFLDGVSLTWTTYVNAMMLLWSLIFWGALAFVGYVLFATSLGQQIMDKF